MEEKSHLNRVQPGDATDMAVGRINHLLPSKARVIRSSLLYRPDFLPVFRGDHGQKAKS